MYEPMLARSAEESDLSTKDWTGWSLEPKHDGMRAIIEITDAGVEIYSRTGKSQKGKCPHLEHALSFLPHGTVLDGEIAMVVNSITVNGQDVPVVDFNKTMRVMGSGVEKAVLRQQELGEVSFLVFDIMQYCGEDVTTYSQKYRNELVDMLDANYMVHNPKYETDFAEVYAELIANGVEGAILKNLNAMQYVAGRSKNWLKVKSAKTFDVVVMGYTPGQGKYEGNLGAIEFGAYLPNGVLKYVGRCSGMTDEERGYWFKKLSTGVHPHGVIEVKANEMVGSGEYRTPRHPQYVTKRIDKNPEDCKMDQFKA
jgi:bifunctional non-homologous end joining protein LigD